MFKTVEKTTLLHNYRCTHLTYLMIMMSHGLRHLLLKFSELLLELLVQGVDRGVQGVQAQGELMQELPAVISSMSLV